MSAVSQKQQQFFGIVRAIQTGKMAPTTPETAKAAADVKKSDVKDFASTKHKGLPKKKVTKEETKYDRYDNQKKEFDKSDKRMKFGRFYNKAREARDRLLPGEVRKWDPEKKRYVSNRD